MLYYGIVDLIFTSSIKLYRIVDRNDIEDIKVTNRKDNDSMRTAMDINPERAEEFVKRIMQGVIRINTLLPGKCISDSIVGAVLIVMMELNVYVLKNYSNIRLVCIQTDIQFRQSMIKKQFKKYDEIPFMW